MDSQKVAALTERFRRIGREVDAVFSKAIDEGRGLTASEQRRLDKLDSETAEATDLLDRAESMAVALSKVPRGDSYGAPYGSLGRVGAESSVYRPDRPETSFFRDVLADRFGDPGARGRIEQFLTESGQRERFSMTTGAGSGAGLAPPFYLQDLIARYARAGRVVADRMNKLPLPATGQQVNVPRVTTGSTLAVQASEGAAVADNSPVTDFITLNVATIAGKVDMSRQLSDRSEPMADQLLAQDLAADYAKQIDNYVINAATIGLLNQSGSNTVTFTQATPTVPLSYPKWADAIRQIGANRFAPADTVVFNPLAWGWVLGSVDSSARPFVVPTAAGPTNALATITEPTAEGAAGNLMGVPVFVDGNMPTNLGAGTNESWVLAFRGEDHVLFEAENGPYVKVYEEVLSGTLQVRLLLFNYAAFSCGRYPKSTSVVKGTGTITPAL